MKNIGFILFTLLPAVLYAQSNGLYMVVNKGGMEVVDVTGDTIRFNHKKKIAVSRAFVFSINNDNSSFYAELIVKKFSEKSRPSVLCINGKYYQAKGWGSSNDVYSVSLPLTRDQAEEVAKAFNVPCNLRKHFGQVLKYEFVPLKDDYKAGDSVYVKFKITNNGNASIWYNHGGCTDNSNGRCNYFKFDVYYNGILLPDEGPKWDFGGEELHPELKPGVTDSLIECITKWSHFTKPGKYVVKCTYRLHFQNEYNTKNYPDNQADLHKAWDEKAEQSIEINIKE